MIYPVYIKSTREEVMYLEAPDSLTAREHAHRLIENERQTFEEGFSMGEPATNSIIIADTTPVREHFHEYGRAERNARKHALALAELADDDRQR